MGGFRGPEIQKSGKTTKRMDQLAPNLAHMCGFIWEWTEAKTVSSSRPKVGTWGVLGGQKCKSQENLPSGCTDWQQICYTSADSSGNGRRLKTISPSIPQGAFCGILGGHKMHKSGKSTKRLYRLAPHLVNICGFIWEWT